ncbi:PAN2-PAN3 deadenylation complex subunit PAN3 isoform X1 [Topomyia yanbarensis]|uniref:PAN2-PAN3 deadenylation complex subunit PAN3 isoform X1 n=1 Tax=Topomyia yanbarensis TaxID=2498891 RepID=UPI00273A893B|nr:PAN2-PAN3 deadenylation complex subunit PAN3 isoform X1 [Topomyia yanbarensis]XP_058835747.1 PAN2-PAN3 deadenylation complex subunit PAN3 isoform X1 [Topomyia yanbarensis]XP_058835748.1 PAN2-PAN3 deadenylation complex subunit PAN3 isoform X1 [Topomyia yanbarensis]XP_058835750.1 PAN2-PAN3 deadenylation complex subunit PAN3 isoform X1 [Topomyia yanbarensis]
MDPIFFSPPNGVPSESKLATYMSRQNVSTPTYGLSSGLSKLNLDSPISIKKNQVTPQSPEFIPTNRLNTSSSPNFYSSYSILGSNGTTGTGGIAGIGSSSVIASSNGTTVVVAGTGSASVVQSQTAQLSSVATTIVPTGVGGGGGGGGGGGAGSSGAKSQASSYGSSILGSSLSNSSTYAVTPIKGRSLLRNESPQSTNTSPRITPQPSPPPIATNIHQENVGGTTYFYPTAANHQLTPSSTVNTTENTFVHVTSSQINLSYSHPGHVYPGPASHVANMQPKAQVSMAYFLQDELRNDILTRNETVNSIETECQDLPLEVENYHSLCLLESMPVHPKLPLPSSTYKATNHLTGVKYCLRRLHGFRLQSTKCMQFVDMWKKLQHTNVVQMREVFTTKTFGDNSLVIVYDYHPGSQTLLSKYFIPSAESTNGYTDPFSGEARPFSHKSSLHRTAGNVLLPENEIWSIIIQLTAGLRAIHQAGLACRTLDPTKIIITGKRIRFSCVAISDIATYDPNQPNPLSVVSHHQQDDLTALGKLILALACRSLQSVQRDQIQNSIELISRHYSSDLRNIILYLLSSSNRRSVTEIMPMIGARFYVQLDALQAQCDIQEDELAKEMENGRLYRLLIKLGTVNERPELNLDVTWSETGDRYMLKLFRDYLFHTVAEDGRPWLNQSHIVQCLNKLDAGTMEKVQLMSRDEQSVLVVTYAELKHCLEQAFSELVTAATV